MRRLGQDLSVIRDKMHKASYKGSGSESMPFLCNGIVLIGAGQAVSSLLGWVRNIVVAALFGATSETDAFLLANLIPGIIFSAINGAFNAVIVPFFVDIKRRSSEGHAWGFAVMLALVYLACTGFLALVGIALAPWLVSSTAPALSGSAQSLTIKLQRILLPTIAFFGLALIGSNVLAAERRFSAAAFASSVFNLIVIGFMLLWGSKLGVSSWGVGTILGAATQALFVGFLIYREVQARGVVVSFVGSAARIKELMALTLPTLAGTGLLQIKIFIARVLGARLDPGSISALNYADMIVLSVVSVVGMAFATGLLPQFSDSCVREHWPSFRSQLRKGLLGMWGVIVPLGVFFLLFGHPVVSLAFQRGAFNDKATTLTAGALRMYLPALIARSLIVILTAGFSARQDTRTPAFSALVDVVVTLVFAFVLLDRMGHLGLALAGSLGWTVYAVSLFLLLEKEVRFIDSEFVSYFVRITFSVLFAGVCAWTLLLALNRAAIVLRIAVALISGCAVYILALVRTKL